MIRSDVYGIFFLYREKKPAGTPAEKKENVKPKKVVKKPAAQKKKPAAPAKKATKPKVKTDKVS